MTEENDCAWADRPTRESISGKCESCEFWCRDGERAWWGTCEHLLADLPPYDEATDADDDSLITTSSYDWCEKYKEGEKTIKETLDRWMALNGGAL